MRLRRAIVSASYLRPSWYSRSADDLAGSWEIPGERCRHPNLPVAVSLAGQLSILICVLMFLMSTPVRAATSQSLVFLDGSDPTNLINDGACDPSAFPDRDRIVYVLHTRGGVWRLLYGNTGPPRYSSPSPDGRWLLFSGPGNGFVPPDCGPGTENGWFPTGCNYLYVANLMTDELLRLVDIPARFYQASFSPDASMIAYVRATPNHPGILKVMNSDGSDGLFLGRMAEIVGWMWREKSRGHRMEPESCSHMQRTCGRSISSRVKSYNSRTRPPAESMHQRTRQMAL